MSQRFAVMLDNRVLASGFLLGRVYHHADQTSTHKPGKWFAVEQAAGIVGIVSDRSHAALLVAREAGYPDACLLDIDFEHDPSQE